MVSTLRRSRKPITRRDQVQSTVRSPLRREVHAHHAWHQDHDDLDSSATTAAIHAGVALVAWIPIPFGSRIVIAAVVADDAGTNESDVRPSD